MTGSIEVNGELSIGVAEGETDSEKGPHPFCDFR